MLSVEAIVRLALSEDHDPCGYCPDPVCPDSRDPECVACQALIAAENAQKCAFDPVVAFVEQALHVIDEAQEEASGHE